MLSLTISFIYRQLNMKTLLNAEAKAPVFWSSDANRQLIGKAPDVRKDQGQKEKRVSENEMAG